jgi:uncharacterized membrane protein
MEKKVKRLIIAILCLCFVNVVYAQMVNDRCQYYLGDVNRLNGKMVLNSTKQPVNGIVCSHNGKMYLEKPYKDGKIEGIRKGYDESGKLVLEILIKDDVMVRDETPEQGNSLAMLGAVIFIALVIFIIIFVVKGRKKQTSQTPDVVGKQFFACACEAVFKDLEKPKYDNIKSIRNSSSSTSTFDVELLITVLYAAANSIHENIGSNDKAYKVYDSIYASFVDYLKTVVAKTGGKNIDGQFYLMSRHKEYDDARQENRGPNELWPLSLHILKNLLGKETVDIKDFSIYDITAIQYYYVTNVRLFNSKLTDIKLRG